MTEPVLDGADEFLAVAQQALRGTPGPKALDALGWWSLLPDLTDSDIRGAVFSLFRAQGRELADTNALAGLMAQPYLTRIGGEPGTIASTITRASRERGLVTFAVGEVTGMGLLVDRPDHGVLVLEPGQFRLTHIDIAGRLRLQEVEIAADAGLVGRGRTSVIGETDASTARLHSTFLGRVALALEMLGAAEGAVALALEHARTREQFGQPIGSFQAVRHLLAWATADCVAVERVAAEAVRLDRAGPPRFDEITKAIAGRNGRRACERALQVLGGIGFTAEHAHHHFHSRVLALDSLLGTSFELTRGLGAWLRTLGHDPTIPATVLLSGTDGI